MKYEKILLYNKLSSSPTDSFLINLTMYNYVYIIGELVHF